MKIHRLLPRAVASAALLTLPNLLNAAVIVDLSPSDAWVTANGSLARSMGANTFGEYGGQTGGTAGTIGALSDVYRLMPNDASNALGNLAVPSGRFHGATFLRYNDYYNGGNASRPGYSAGLQDHVAAVTTYDFARLASNTGTTVKPDPATAATGTVVLTTGGVLQSLVYWKQADFLSGDAAAELAAGSTFTAGVRDRSGASSALMSQITFNFVAEVAGAFYVSSDLQLPRLSGNPFQTLSYTVAAEDLWRPLSLNSAIDAINPNYLVVGGSASTLDLSAVTAVGLIYQANHNATVTGSQSLGFEMTNFSVSAIPEPAALTWCAALLAALWTWRRRA